MKPTDKIFDELKLLIVDQLGLRADKVTPFASFMDDLGIYGDDGYELFKVLDEYYDIEWDGLDVGVMFGNEGSGLLLPWDLKNNCALYECQPCSVSDVVKAIESGKWEPTPLVLKTSVKLFGLYTASYLYFGALVIILGIGIFSILL